LKTDVEIDSQFDYTPIGFENYGRGLLSAMPESEFYFDKPIVAFQKPNRPSENCRDILLARILTTSLINLLRQGRVAAFQAGNCPKGSSETFNWFPFGPTWSLTMIEQRGDREYRRDQPTFHGYDRQQLRSAPHAETRAAF
jgi:hypothetical protein